MKKTVKVLVEVKIEEKNPEKRTAAVAHVKQQANTYGASLEYCNDREGTTTLAFATDTDPKILEVLLSN